ncbi:unnamed protein product [Prorocentrum cordatum]|uniref:BRCT domain-containing protein n=1 Tax=Prorocentrum cordatum TaxID=2364126 RepID=A0ABN9R0W9_9DINO|nr:unnamed protein product [Polarella glacialis]
MQGLVVCFTGELDGMDRQAAEERIKEAGGKIGSGVSSNTTYLVVGARLDDGRAVEETSKYRKYLELKEKGKKHPQLLNEEGLLDLLGQAGLAAPAAPPPVPTAPAAAVAAAAAAPPRGASVREHSNWVDAHAPRSLGDLVGNAAPVRKLAEWLRDWDHVVLKGNKKQVAFRPGGGAPDNVNARAALVSGPPGIGKTTTARLVAQLQGKYEVLEYNASDARGMKVIQDMAEGIADNTTISFGRGASGGQKVSGFTKRACIIMDEVDGMGAGDRGGNAALIKMIKKTRNPIICICNDAHSQKIRSLAFSCYDLKFTRPPKGTIAQRCAEIAKREGLSVEPNALEALAESCGGDMRMILNQLQALAKSPAYQQQQPQQLQQQTQQQQQKQQQQKQQQEEDTEEKEEPQQNSLAEPGLARSAGPARSSESASDVQAELARLQNTLKYQKKRTMADFLSQFPEEPGAGAVSGVSHCYVARARDAFAELLKELNGQELERLSATNVGGTPFFIQHIHDEASMRLRSTPVVEDASFALPRSAAVGSALFTRSRYSKIQNSCITIGMGEQRLEWLSEMQALGRKDGDTLGLALIDAVQGIMKILAALPQRAVRVVHLLIGDGINTNEAAAKRLFEHYGRRAGGILQYRLITWRCASHQANLVVEVALCGKLLSRPLEENDLAANCSRFFKYLLAEHCDQFATALRHHIASTLQFDRYDEKAAAPPPSEAVLNMQRLYGKDVFPDSLVDIFPSNLSGSCHLFVPACIKFFIDTCSKWRNGR